MNNNLSNNNFRVSTVFQNIKKKLASINRYSNQLETEIILSYVLKKDKTTLYLNFEDNLNSKQLSQINELVKRRLQREPLAYIIEETNFYGRDFIIKKPVLIPRVDSEILVDAILNLPKKKTIITALEIGGGCGNLAISLACATKIKIDALDISQKAITISKLNAEKHKETLTAIDSKIEFQKANIFTSDIISENKKYDLIFSNPPYISESEMNDLMPEVANWESKKALEAGSDGLKFYTYFAKKFRNLLKPNGWLVCEHGWQQKNQIVAIFKKYNWHFYASYQDLGQRDRVLIFQPQN